MAWEQRSGRRYLYRSARRGGRVVREYLGTGPDAELMARRLDIDRQRRADDEFAARASFDALQAEIGALLNSATVADAALESAAEQLMSAAGFHRPKRGPWRRKRAMAKGKGKCPDVAALIARLRANDPPNHNPMIRYEAPTSNPTAVDVFKRARAGDADAIRSLRDVFDDLGSWEWIGHVDRQVTDSTLDRLSDGDPVWKLGLIRQANKVLDELLGDNPTILDRLLARRIQVAWLVVARLELEQAHRTPGDIRRAEYLDRALTRAQRRLCDAARALAAVRRTSAPLVLQQLNVAAGPQQVNNGG